MSQLRDLYATHFFPGADKLYRLAKDTGLDVTVAQVKEFIKSQEVAQLHYKAPRSETHPIVTFTTEIEQQIDLLDLVKHKGSNRGYSYLLIMEDIFSRKAFAYPLKTKMASDVVQGVEAGFKAIGQPKHVTSDSGSEFKGAVDAYFKEKNITHHVTEPGNHNVLGIIDSLSRNFKSRIYRYFTAHNNTTWVDTLQQMVDSYNVTPHASLDNLTPGWIHTHDWDGRAVQNQKLESRASPKELTIGDRVRIKKRKATFSKGYTIRYSRAIYTINSKEGNRYVLSNGSSHGADQLQKVVKPAKAESKEDEINAVERDDRQARQKRLLNEEGVEAINRREGLRERAPRSQLEHSRYGLLKW